MRSLMKLPFKKLRKLRKDPDRFFYDMFAKRVSGTPSAKPKGSLSFDTTDYDVDGAVVVITNPTVVQRLREIKQSGARRARLGLTWWA